MKDIHGTEITIGARVCKTDEAAMKRYLTVRWFNADGEACADDGDPNNNDMHTNGSKLCAWLRKGDKVEVIDHIPDAGKMVMRSVSE